MIDQIPTLGQYRIDKLRRRVERLERALIEAEARIFLYGVRGSHHLDNQLPHYRTLAENELVREGLVRPAREREMEER